MRLVGRVGLICVVCGRRPFAGGCVWYKLIMCSKLMDAVLSAYYFTHNIISCTEQVWLYRDIFCHLRFSGLFDLI
jgi:hypothetical protein